MNDLKSALIARFGASKVSDFSFSDDDYIELLKVDIDTKKSQCIIVTNGISNYEMPVPGQYQGKEFNELYFCFPKYWDLEDKINPKTNWPFEKLQKLAKNVIENKTWYGRGHTISNGNPPKALSENMKQEYFILGEPIAMEDFLRPIEVAGKEVNFLSVIPIFQEEYNIKNSLGYKKWIRNYRLKNGTEILDSFRTPVKISLLNRLFRGK